MIGRHCQDGKLFKTGEKQADAPWKLDFTAAEVPSASVAVAERERCGCHRFLVIV